MKLVLATAVALCLQGATLAQTSSKRPEFKVASVKQAAPAASQSADGMRSTGAGSVSVSADRASYQGVTLQRLLMIAYDLKASQVSGPTWIYTERYDVATTFPAGTSKEDLAAMLQNLVGDRFQINQHTEKKEEPVYALRIGTDGPKLRPSTSDHAQPADYTVSEAGVGQMRYIGNTMADFADVLSAQMGRAVTDETGLAGRFDILLPVDPKDATPGSQALSSSLLTAVQSVGLKLEPGKATAKHLVVDKAEQVPTEN
jgi:uncharacterized protein (TIGR03435 family)